MFKWLKKLTKQQQVAPETMRVIGNDDVGWSAKYEKDADWCTASTKEIAIFGCEQRHQELLSGKLERTSEGRFFTPFK